ncbi:hypothetical protein BDV95DRAFT_4400 [Massariosphaeria phaeospora]|uniref:Uncharacterized protein n=1 Tax=Massariosphaeria phaeospora TaxID=100035 RepID=A0A7C8IQT1_9PLEO|nr:hypothetical protein BDV95DRAFT_4400 [Massariosphaeria phaeospora]
MMMTTTMMETTSISPGPSPTMPQSHTYALSSWPTNRSNNRYGRLFDAPPPLLNRKLRLPPNSIPVAVFDIDVHKEPSPSPSPSPPTSVLGLSSSTPSSTPNSPSSRTRVSTYSPCPSPSSSSWTCTSTSTSPSPSTWSPAPRHSLRRKPSPKKESLRSLRAKESDACLQRIFNQQTLAYLDGSILAGRRECWGA